MLKKLVSFIVLLAIYSYNVESQESFHSKSNFSTKTNSYFLHTVERGQTAYSISVMYNVGIESIYKLNPGSEEKIRAGETLKIPQETPHIVYHTIQPKETLYAVSKKYNIQAAYILEANPGLSTQTFTIGKTILIPIYKEVSVGAGGKTTADERESEINALLHQEGNKLNVNMINIALLLPFGTIDTDASNASISQRIVEYYEGFMLALDSLKKTGISVSLNVYDIGYDTQNLKKILNKEELKKNHLIIGGYLEEQINMISTFSKANAIRYVIPFTSKADETQTNPYVFQTNPPQSYLYSKVSLAFTKANENNSIIFINMNDKTDKAALIETMQADLKEEKIPFQSFTYAEHSFNKDLKDYLDPYRKNIIILSSGTSEALARLAAPLRIMRESGSHLEVSLFGYPEWQTYTKDFLEDFYATNTCIYSVFYANNTLPELKEFHKTYRRWYSKQMLNSYPRYGILGYDAGMYFIQMISRYGINFENSLSKFQYESLQTGYNFKRVSNWGGLININVYWIEYSPDYSIKRTTIK